MVGTAGVKSDMSIRADAAQEKPDASFFPDFCFILAAPLVNFKNRLFLKLFLLGLHFAVAQRKVNLKIGENFAEMQPFGQLNFV